MVRTVLLLFTILMVPAGVFADDNDGLVTKQSPHSVQDTVKRLKKAIGELKPVSIMAEVDHQKNANKAEMELRPTYLVLFGNPKLGTQLFTSTQTAGIDLPMKALVWQDEGGKVWITYNDPAWIAERHDIDDRDDVIKKMQQALDKLTDQAIAQ